MKITAVNAFVEKASSKYIIAKSVYEAHLPVVVGQSYLNVLRNVHSKTMSEIKRKHNEEDEIIFRKRMKTEDNW